MNKESVNELSLPNAAQVLDGFIRNEKLSLKIISGTPERGYEINQSVLCEYLMKFVQFIEKESTQQATPSNDIEQMEPVQGELDVEKMAREKAQELFDKREQTDGFCNPVYYEGVKDGFTAALIEMHNTAQGKEWVKDYPIRVKNLSMSRQIWINIYYNTIHNNEVVADTLMKPEEEAQADFYHTAETNKRKSKQYAIDLAIQLLRDGIRITFLDGGKSSDVIKQVSPPLWEKYYQSISTFPAPPEK